SAACQRSSRLIALPPPIAAALVNDAATGRCPARSPSVAASAYPPSCIQGEQARRAQGGRDGTAYRALRGRCRGIRRADRLLLRAVRLAGAEGRRRLRDG